MNMFSKYTALFLIFISTLCHANDSQERWQSAQDAYLRGEMERAASLFEEYLVAHPTSHAAMYNLANCYLQLGNTGKSILWYERALRLKPNDADTRHNVAIANARRIEPVVEIREFFLMRWIRVASGLLSVQAWSIMSLLFFWASIALLAKRVRSGIGNGRAMIVAITGCFILSVFFAVQRYRDLRRDHIAIVLADQIQISIAPEAGSKLVSKVYAGEKVMIIDSLDQFLKVRLANYEQGWLPAEAIERI